MRNHATDEQKRRLTERFSGLGITGQWPPVLGQYLGQKALVVASGHCVWDDLDRLGVHGDDNSGWHTVCVNDMIQYYPGVVNHGYSNQHRWLPHWVGGRRETINGYKVVEKWGRVGMTHSCHSGGQYNWPWPGNGTSTLGAVYTAIGLGYDPIVICGAPLDDGPHFFEPPWCRSNFTNEVGNRRDGKLIHWQNAATYVFKDRVRSMSGRSMEILGAP